MANLSCPAHGSAFYCCTRKTLNTISHVWLIALKVPYCHQLLGLTATSNMRTHICGACLFYRAGAWGAITPDSTVLSAQATRFPGGLPTPSGAEAARRA
eukprot:1160784-Pelagomonas_calceolata.AAC.4